MNKNKNSKTTIINNWQYTVYYPDMSAVLDKLRDELSKATESWRLIASAGISEAMLSRFLAGEHVLGIKKTERLADYFGMRLVLEPKRAYKWKRG